MNDEQANQGRPIRRALLLGAGFSFDLGMPLAVEVTEVFLSLFNERSARRFGAALSKQDPYGQGRPIDPSGIRDGLDLILSYKRDGGTNYEEVLARLETLPWKGQPTKDAHHFLFSTLYDILYDILTAYQRLSYELVYPSNHQWFAPLSNLLSSEETWVFTLNHDLYLECLAIDQATPVTYGDTNRIEFPLSNREPNTKVALTYSKREDFRIDGPGWFQKTRGINLVALRRKPGCVILA